MFSTESMTMSCCNDLQMVDVGCGIGGSSRHIARKFGCRAEGITLSPVQVLLCGAPYPPVRSCVSGLRFEKCQACISALRGLQDAAGQPWCFNCAYAIMHRVLHCQGCLLNEDCIWLYICRQIGPTVYLRVKA